MWLTKTLDIDAIDYADAGALFVSVGLLDVLNVPIAKRTSARLQLITCESVMMQFCTRTQRIKTRWSIGLLLDSAC
jgi:hypothetical protein